MKYVVCPHCKKHRIMIEKIPRHMIIIVPCPKCEEYVLLFRNKAIALNRKILEGETLEERAEHLAPVIAEFLEAGMLSLDPNNLDEHEAGLGFDPKPRRVRRKRREASGQPISDQEVDRFVRIELERIDDAEYFKKHFT